MANIITALTWQKRNKNRVNVDIDGKFAFGISSNLISHLSIGKEITNDEIDNLCKLDQFEIAYGYALHLLSYRMRSVNELKIRMFRKGLRQEVVDSTITRLEGNELLSDQKFTREWVENRNSFRPRSHRLLTYELKNKGISDDIISSELESAQDDETLALKAAQKYATRLEQLDYQKFRTRLSGFLLRRGFNYTIVKNVVQRIWTETDSQKGINNG